MNTINKSSNIVQKGELTLFRTIWNTSKDNMFIVRKENSEYISERANESLKKTFNLNDVQTSEISLKKLLDEDTYNKVTQKYDLCIKKNEILTYEESHNLNNQELRYWETTIIPVIDENENITRIFGISKEITQFKRMNEILEKEVEKRTKELKDALEKLKEVSITDKLTEVYNRHHLDYILEDISKIIHRYENNYGLIILDLDEFKNINDNFGHHVGDVVLKEFSTLLKNSIRQTDILGRWGGDEFLILVPFATKESIEIFSNNILKKISSHKFSYINKLSSSLGVTIIKKDDTEESFISRADKALYKAKKAGKNKVEILL